MDAASQGIVCDPFCDEVPRHHFILLVFFFLSLRGAKMKKLLLATSSYLSFGLDTDSKHHSGSSLVM